METLFDKLVIVFCLNFQINFLIYLAQGIHYILLLKIIPSSFISAGKLVTVLMIACTILVLALPVPIIVSNFVVANDLLANDDTVATYYYDENKSNQVKEELQKYLSNKSILETQATLSA